jgi:pilus assembly protein FimV
VPASDAAEQRAEDNSLDFDLGGLTFEPIKPDHQASAPAPAVAAAVPAAFATPAALDNELTFAPQAPAAAAESEVPSPAEEHALDMAFDMDFAAPDTGKAAPAVTPDEAFAAPAEAQLADLKLDGISLDLPTPEPKAAEPAPALALSDDFMLDNLEDLTAEFAHLDTPAAAEQQAQTDAALHDLDALSFDLPGSSEPAAEPKGLPTTDEELLAELSLPDLPGSPAAAPAAPAPAEFDLSAIDLDLPAVGQHATPAAEPDLPDLGDIGAAAAPAPVEAADLSPEHMEMETKLDLAIAYQEIGDKEGARELLDEVLKGGNNDQVAKANSLLAQLA